MTLILITLFLAPHQTVTVRNCYGGMLPIWANRKATVPLVNPLWTDAHGMVKFAIKKDDCYVVVVK